MKFISTQVSLLVIFFVTFSACDNKKADVPNDIVYDSIAVSKIYHLENDSTKPSCSVKIKYIYPVQYTDSVILHKIQREFNYALLEDESYEALSPANAVDKYITDYIANYKEAANVQFPDWASSEETDDYFSFYKTLSSEVLYDKGGVISYQTSSMDFKGGANSSTFYKNVIIDLKTGDVVTEKEIFIPEYKKILNTMLTDKIVAQNNVKKAEDLLEFGYWGIEDIASNNNFSINDKGLTYIFNQGEYSAPSLGAIKVPFSYSELFPILKDNSPISNLSGK
ncbi:MAG: RsiV family protein [Prevotella sp.]|jgi:hypothetical protein|nr:RsiV family protein [Prevotella sp.]